MRPLAVFDIDGVLADVGHRVHHLEGARQDWQAFFNDAVYDPVHPEGLAMALRAAQECELAFVTGRPDSCRDDTRTWLAAAGIPDGMLRMRRDGDRRPARQVKVRLLRELAKGRTIAVVVDDDAEVCSAYEAEGWPVLRATWAVPVNALQQAQDEQGRT